MSKLAVIGDCHAEWRALHEVMQHALDNNQDLAAIVQVGDFGFHMDPYHPTPDEGLPIYEEIGARSIKLFWLDGNHEHFDKIDQGLTGRLSYWRYMRRGAFSCINDRWPAVFFGGATSIDKHMRQPHRSWWPQESITYRQVHEALIESKQHGWTKIAFSHDFPLTFPVYHRSGSDEIGYGDRVALDTVFEAVTPKFWFGGHHHFDLSGETNGCRWFVAPITTRSYGDFCLKYWLLDLETEDCVLIDTQKS